MSLHAQPPGDARRHNLQPYLESTMAGSHGQKASDRQSVLWGCQESNTLDQKGAGGHEEKKTRSTEAALRLISRCWRMRRTCAVRMLYNRLEPSSPPTTTFSPSLAMSTAVAGEPRPCTICAQRAGERNGTVSGTRGRAGRRRRAATYIAASPRCGQWRRGWPSPPCRHTRSVRKSAAKKTVSRRESAAEGSQENARGATRQQTLALSLSDLVAVPVKLADELASVDVGHGEGHVAPTAAQQPGLRASIGATGG